MKKIFLLAVAAIALSFTQASAQNYKNALGLGLDFGDGMTFVGPSFKHFFNANNAIQPEILFGNDVTLINALWAYHKPIQGAAGLQWNLGVGPALYLYDGGSTFGIKPTAGLDYKIAGAPLSLAFDWRPTIYLGDYDSDFQAGRFGLGFRFTF